jgi:hypothetical protein
VLKRASVWQSGLARTVGNRHPSTVDNKTADLKVGKARLDELQKAQRAPWSAPQRLSPQRQSCVSKARPKTR